MRRTIKKGTAFLCSLLLLLSRGASAVSAGETAKAIETNAVEVSEETAAEEEKEDISLTVSIFENIEREWILPPMQLACESDIGLSGLMDKLVQYAYLNSATVRGGRLISLVDPFGQTYTSNGEEDKWLIILNGIERTSLTDAPEDGEPFHFSDGDTLQLVYSSLTTSENTASTASSPSRSLSDTPDELPWDNSYDSVISSACGWLKNNSDSVETLTALGAAGYSVDYKYLSRILQRIRSEDSPTALELAKSVLAISFSGISAENFSGEDLVKKLSEYPDMGRLDTVYGLLAYDCNNYTIPDDALNSRDAMINIIMAGQNADGGISETQGEPSDVFLTALSLTALAPYRDDDSIGPCIERALDWLSGEQHSNALYYDGAVSSSRQTSAVILALGSLSVSLADSRFSKNGIHMLDALMRFYSDGSGFSEKRGDTPDAESTELALLALCSQKNRRNPLVLRSPVTGSGSINFSSSDEETDSSSEAKTDSDARTRMHSGLIGVILGGSGGIAVMLGVILWMKEKFGHHSDRLS